MPQHTQCIHAASTFFQSLTVLCVSLTALQVDAAINSGNSGGRVLLGDHVVGIAFQCLTSGENIGYIIPVPVINHFLEDLERNGKHTGEPALGTGAWPHTQSSLE